VSNESMLFFAMGLTSLRDGVLWSRVVWENCRSLRFELCGGRGVCV